MKGDGDEDGIVDMEVVYLRRVQDFAPAAGEEGDGDL